jgi:membrane-associated protease RseP (regulator of RpoE activity)
MASYIVCFIVAMLIHELGHLAAAHLCCVRASELGLGWGPRIYGFHLGDVTYKLHALPVGAYVRLDMRALQQRPLDQQVFVLLAGIIVNILAAALTDGTKFSMMNALLATTNLLPFYQQDGWKCGIVILRAIMKRRSLFVEWTFTIVGGLLSLLLFAVYIYRYM